ncbi:MAG TPA: hypothetical protein VIT88_05390 [Pyrinomonadaceae bacterium]
MKSLFESWGIAALTGLVLVLPLVVLEAVNNTITTENLFGLLLLFALMWLLPTVFILLLMPLLRRIRNGGSGPVRLMPLMLRVTSLVLIAAVWGWGLADQLPCFLGIPNCD